MSEGETISRARKTLLALLAERRSDATICPSEAARRLAPEAWRSEMPAVHAAVRALEAAGLVVVTQSGAAVAAEGIVGPYRIRLARRRLALENPLDCAK